MVLLTFDKTYFQNKQLIIQLCENFCGKFVAAGQKNQVASRFEFIEIYYILVTF